MSDYAQPESNYGITWATEEEQIAQTGYDYAALRDAVRDAVRGPAEVGKYRQVEYFGGIRPVHGHLYGQVETEDDAVVEVAVGSGEVVTDSEAWEAYVAKHGDPTREEQGL